MSAIEIVFVFAAGLGVIAIPTIMVIIGVRQEELYKTALRGRRPPTACAVLARRILGAHFYLIPEERPDRAKAEEEPPWFERPVGPRAS